jgi:hypothetical protein
MAEHCGSCKKAGNKGGVYVEPCKSCYFEKDDFGHRIKPNFVKDAKKDYSGDAGGIPVMSAMGGRKR